MRHDGAVSRGTKGTAGRSRLALTLAIASAAFLLQVPVSAAAPARITAAEKCCTFVPGPFEQARGEVATFVNPAAAGVFHNVVATGRGPDGGDLFFSEAILPGSEAPIAGTQYLEAGVYPFVCSFHLGMDGELTVSDSGKPVARPQVRSTIPRQPLRRVTRKGAIKVSVSSPTGAAGAFVVIRIGKRKVGSVSSLDLDPNRTRTITVRLSAKGRRVLKGKRSVAFTTETGVPFGIPSRSRKVIR